MGDLAADTAVEGEGGRYQAELSRDWEIWGPNGGYLAAIALRAAGASTPLRRPATFTCHYLGVADFEHVDLLVEPIRESKRAASLRVSMRQHDRPILEAMVWVVGELDGLHHDAAGLPDVPPPEALPSVAELMEGAEEGTYHRFWSNFEQRPINWLPREAWESREPGEPRTQGWYRYLPAATFADPFVDAARVLLLIDTLMWPAAVRAYRNDELTYYAPSIDLSAQFHALAPQSEWLLCESHSPSARDGLVGGTTTVWSQDGRLLGTGSQQMMCRPGTLQPGTVQPGG